VTGEVVIRIVDLPEIQTALTDASVALFSANVELENLRKMLADANAREEAQIKRLGRLNTIIKLVVDRGACSIVPCDGIGDRKCDVHQAIADLDPKPVPMCKVDALEDLFPPAEGSPT
jgi:hypothetical protein